MREHIPEWCIVSATWNLENEVSCWIWYFHPMCISNKSHWSTHDHVFYLQHLFISAYAPCNCFYRAWQKAAWLQIIILALVVWRWCHTWLLQRHGQAGHGVLQHTPCHLLNQRPTNGNSLIFFHVTWNSLVTLKATMNVLLINRVREAKKYSDGKEKLLKLLF